MRRRSKLTKIRHEVRHKGRVGESIRILLTCAKPCSEILRFTETLVLVHGDRKVSDS